jgi:hypothetical protein
MSPATGETTQATTDAGGAGRHTSNTPARAAEPDVGWRYDHDQIFESAAV